MKLASSQLDFAILGPETSSQAPEAPLAQCQAQSEPTPLRPSSTILDAFAYNNHNESIFDDCRYFPGLRAENASVVKFDAQDGESISQATLKALVVQLTSPEVIDYSLICDFFLTYRTFSDSHTVLSLLVTRLVWALQYIRANDAASSKLGKLVLLRTFVVMRHWILNYFYDDFEQDDDLCNAFVYHINQITHASGLVSAEMPFEAKIFSDLKTHWLAQIAEFYNYAPPPEPVFNTPLPSLAVFAARKMTKSNTEASIHTNASFRRSAMLSLYDQRVHHKCIVYDGADESQIPIGNLLSQHKSSRLSLNDKLRDYHAKPASKKDRLKVFRQHEAPSLAPKHTYLGLSDSSLALKKTSSVPESPTEPEGLIKTGFSTNGHVTLPSSKVTKIVPNSPVKKMNFSLKNQQNSNSLSRPASILEVDEFGRKTSIKKIVENWTKSFHSADSKSEKSPVLGSDAPACPETPEPVVDVIGDRVDILSARIVDELEFVIRYYIADKKELITEANDDISRSAIEFSPKEKQDVEVASMAKDPSCREIYELNIEKIDNLFSLDSLEHEVTKDISSPPLSKSSRRSSFGGRVTSINWNEGNLFLDNSALLCETSIVRSETKYFDLSSLAQRASQLERFQSESSEFDSSDLENYDADIADLGIAMSPQKMQKRVVLRISFSENLASRGIAPLSRNSSGSMCKSMKSYLSYDSAFSAISEDRKAAQMSSNLKKKNACQNLRKLAHVGSEEPDIFRQSMPSPSPRKRASTLSRRSVRFSTLCALTELPFNSLRGSIGSERGMEMSENSQNPIGIKDVRDQSDRSSTASVAIPGITNLVLKELASIPDESFSNKNPILYALSKLEGELKLDLTANTSILSDDDTKRAKIELQLETPEQIGDETDQNCHPDTDQILEEINNAVTEDAIEYSSDIEAEIRRKPVTPIKTKPRSALIASSSTPTMHQLLLSVSCAESGSPYSVLNPKLVLDGYALVSPSLGIETVMELGSHVSFILNYESRAIAEHFTIIERDILQEIDWKELIELKWNKELTPVNSWLEIIVNDEYYDKNKGVNLVIARFNLVVNWIISEILLTTSEDERIEIISRMIHVAYHSYEMQNFATLMQVILALTSEKVSKLKATWQRLQPGDILTMKHLEQLTSPLKNFINIRLSTNQIKPLKGCIPFIGLYLSDLIFNAERPKFAKRQAEKPAAPVCGNDTVGDSTLSTNQSSDPERMINFARFRTSVHIVKSISQSIEWSQNYKISLDQELLKKCLYIKSLDESEMNICLGHHLA